MKRIKNWFDSFDGDYKDMEYRLNGGKTMNNWVESTLNKEREAIKKPKEIKSKTGLSNQFIKTHNKNVNKVNRDTIQIKLPKLHKDISGQIERGKPVYEEVEKIKELKDVYHKMDRESIYDGQDFDNMYMTSFIQYLINSQWEVKATVIDNGWLEVDTIEDLERYESLSKRSLDSYCFLRG